MLTNIQTDNLIELLRTDSPSGQENQVCDYIKKGFKIVVTYIPM